MLSGGVLLPSGMLGSHSGRSNAHPPSAGEGWAGEVPAV